MASDIRTASTQNALSRALTERMREFTGREWVFEALHAWLADPAGSRFFLLSGAPGSGKTTLAARMVELAEARVSPPEDLSALAPGFLGATHFCSARDGRSISPHRFTESLAVQLASRFSIFAEALIENSRGREINIRSESHVDLNTGQVIGVMIKRLEVSEMPAQEAFQRAVREPLEAVCRQNPETQIVLLIDALDESLAYSGPVTIASLLAQTEYLPEGVRLVVTSRPEIEALRALRRHNPAPAELSLTDRKGLRMSGKDIRRYILYALETRSGLSSILATEVTPERLATAIEASSQGNFLYVYYLLEMLGGQEQPITQDFLGALPAGLDAIYVDFMDRIKDTGRPEILRMLGTLAVAQDRLTETQIASFAQMSATEGRAGLTRLRQLLDVDEALPWSQRLYALYHRSFADFLLDRDRAQNYWCEASEQHDRFLRHYRGGASSWARVVWQEVDDYGLRYVLYHTLHGETAPVASYSDILTPGFVRAKIDRFGSERSLLDDLRLATKAAQQAGELAWLLVWAWVYVGFRDRLAEAIVPEALSVYVHTGQIRQAMDRIESLDENTDEAQREVNKARHHMALALADHGHYDQASRVAQSITPEKQERDETLLGVAARWARTDRQRALEIVRNVPLGSEAGQVLCRVLAEDPAFVDEAVRLANEHGPTLAEVARKVVSYDYPRALQVIASIAPYEEISGGERWTRGSDTARADLSTQVAAQDPVRALDLYGTITDKQEKRRAGILLAGAMAVSHPQQALDFVVDKVEEWGGGAWELALGFLAASCSDATIEGLVQRLRVPGEYGSDLDSTTDLLARITLLPLKNCATGSQIALCALRRLAQIVTDFSPEFRYPGDGVGAIAAAFAVFDLNEASVFIQKVTAEQYRSLGNFSNDVWLAVIKTVARFDVDNAVQLIEYTSGYFQHRAYVAIVEAVVEYDFTRALAVVDGVEARYSRTKSILLGILGTRLDPCQDQEARALFARFPRYVESEIFTWTVYRAARALAGEIARANLDRAVEFGREFAVNYSRNPKEHGDALTEVIRNGVTSHPECARTLIPTLGEGRPRGQALLALARAVQDPVQQLELLSQAAEAMQAVPQSIVQNARTLEEIGCALAPLDAWQAVDIAISLQANDQAQAHVYRAAISALLDQKDAPLEELVDYLYDHLRFPEEEDPSRLRTLGERLRAYRAVYDVLDGDNRARIPEMVEFWDRYLATLFRVWIAAESGTEVGSVRALSLLRELEEEDTFWSTIVLGAAKSDPDRAMQLYQTLREGKINARDVLLELLQEIAIDDPAGALAIAEKETWDYSVHYWDAIGDIAGAQAMRDWRRALPIVKRIPVEEEYERSKALRSILRALPDDLPAEDTRLAFLAIAAEAGAIGGARDRRDVYEVLLKTLAARPHASTELASQLVLGLASGDRTVFQDCLADLICLVCKTSPEICSKLDTSFGYVEAMLAA